MVISFTLFVHVGLQHIMNILVLITCSFWKSQASQQEAIRLEEELRKEVECLRTELKQVRDDHDSSITQLTSLHIELTEYKEQAGKSSKECENLHVQLLALKVCSIRWSILVSITLMFMLFTQSSVPKKSW
jgi:hypothetical protein